MKRFSRLKQFLDHDASKGKENCLQNTYVPPSCWSCSHEFRL